MATFQVDAEMLGVAAGRVEGHRQRVVDVGARSAIGDLGSAWLVGVVHDTEAAAAHDMQRTSDILGGLGAFLRSAGRTYRQADDGVRTSVSGESR